MFYGIEVKSNQAQTITLDYPIKLTQAVLEPPKGTKKEPVSLMVESDEREFILCVLDPNLAWQCPLNLMFCPGNELKFFIRGNGTVHLTGYETLEGNDDLEMSMSSSSGDEEIEAVEGGDDNDKDTDSEEEDRHKRKISRMAKMCGKKISAEAHRSAKNSAKRVVPQVDDLLNGHVDSDESDDSDYNAEDVESESDDDIEDEEVDIDESSEEGNTEDEDMEEGESEED